MGEGEERKAEEEEVEEEEAEAGRPLLLGLLRLPGAAEAEAREDSGGESNGGGAMREAEEGRSEGVEASKPSRGECRPSCIGDCWKREKPSGAAELRRRERRRPPPAPLPPSAIH